MHVARIYMHLNRKLTFSALSLCVFAVAMSNKATSQVAPSQRATASSVAVQAGTTAPAALTSLPACGEELALSGALDLQFGAEPGINDPLGVPAGRYQLFPDQGLASYWKSGSETQLKYYTTDKNDRLSLNSSQILQTGPLDPFGDGPVQVYGTAGRILYPDHDSLVTAKRTGPATGGIGRVDLHFLDTSFTVPLPGSLIDRQMDFADFIAIAHGDLDNAADAQGNYHDEVVVARVTEKQGNAYVYRLDVLNYEAGNPFTPDDTNTEFSEAAPLINTDPAASYKGILPSDTILSIVVGDFAGDGKKEIAVAALGNDQRLFLRTYRYETFGQTHKIVEIASQSFRLDDGQIPGEMGLQYLVGTIATAAGDFSGRGADELAVAYAKYAPLTQKPGGYGNGVLLFKYNSQLQASVANWSFAQPTASGNSSDYSYYSRPRVQLVTGQFLLAPPSIPYGRKQLAFGWNKGRESVNVSGLSVSADAKSITSFATYSTPNDSGAEFSLVAGDFQGLGGTAPGASLALGTWATIPFSPFSRMTVSTLRVVSNGIQVAAQDSSTSLGFVDFRARFPLLAYDRPGNSRYLGAPAHFTLLSAPQTDYVMQEPPKHAFWDEGAHKIENFTRFDKNNVHLYNSSSASLSTSSTDETARTTGGSTAVTAGATGTVGGSWGIVKASGTVTADVGLAGSYDYNEHQEQYNSSYGQRTITSTGQTDRDDYLKGSLQTTDIWRYRVFGTPSGGDLNAFYELIMPGPRVNFAGGGLNFDWYQPVHENGNILSYQAKLGPPSNPFIPTDIGSYTLPNGKTLKTPQVPAQLNFFDGSSGTTALSYSDEVAAAGSFTYSHELAESADVKATFTGKVETPIGGGEVRACASAEFHNSNSWGGSNTSTETTKEETAITLNKSAGVSATAYAFYPVVYTTLDGTVKLSFSAPNPADSFQNPRGAGTFATLYGEKPDPALNLPSRMVPAAAGSGELENWMPTTTVVRKKMRGLFFRQPEIDPADNTYPLLGANPADGQTVRIEPRVYNYSTGVSAVGTVAEFQVVPYDSSTDSEICKSGSQGPPGSVCPRSDRTTIGSTTIPNLIPRQFTCVSGYDDPAVTGCAPPAFLNWDTTGFGPSGGSSEYRVYVVLNPNGRAGDEKYGLEPPPVSITNVTNTTPIVVTAPGTTLETGDYVTISGVQGINAANGAFQVTLLSNDEFSLNNSVLTRGTYAGGGSAQLLDPGQNNEGYGYITVAHPVNLVSMTAAERAPQDYLQADALEGLSEQGTAGLQGSAITATLNTPLQLRFTAHSDAVHNDAAQMLFFDGDPAAGAPALAEKTIHPGSHGSNGTSVWFDWTPTTAGTHHLYAVLLEGSGQQQSSGEMEVEVIAQK